MYKEISARDRIEEISKILQYVISKPNKCTKEQLVLTQKLLQALNCFKEVPLSIRGLDLMTTTFTGEVISKVIEGERLFQEVRSSQDPLFVLIKTFE